MNAKIRDLIITNLVAIISGMLISSGMLCMLGLSPVKVFAYSFKTMLSDTYTLGEIFVKTTPLIFTALSFAITFKANLFNIGAQGQFYMGAIAAIGLSLALDGKLPLLILLIIVFLGSVLLGGAAGGIIGYLKARFDANEFLVSMMSTYVIISIMDYLLRTFLKEAKGEYPQTDSLTKNAWIPAIFKGSRLHYGFLIAVLAAVAVWILLYRTPLGFRIRAAGSNKNAAAKAGIDYKRITVITFFISGAMAGMAGFTEVNGVQHMLVQNFSPGIGASGLGIAILANANPIGIIFASILFGVLNVMGNLMGRMPGVNIPSAFIELMQGFVMLFVISAYYVRYRMEQKRDKLSARQKKL